MGEKNDYGNYAENISEELKNKKLEINQIFLKKIWETLVKDNQNYKTEETVILIKEHIGREEKLSRLQYSILTTLIYEITDEIKGNVESNLELLLNFITEKKCNLCNKCKKKQDCENIIIKLYDHFQLANYQVNSIKTISDEITTKIVEKSKEEFNRQIKEEYKEVEKQNITILGIFASIVLGFVGSIVYSTSVLSNMKDISIFRLIFISCIVGIIFINIIYLLLSFIVKLNKDKRINRNYTIGINILLLFIMLLTVLSWSDKFNLLPSMIDKFIVWI